MSYDLECRDVVKAFGSHVAVDHVSLGVKQGSFFSILGPSGCGKTTLMRMVAGFGQPSAGDILIKGRSVLHTPPNKRPVNMVFQHLGLFPMMSVAQNIAYGLKRKGGMTRSAIDKKVAEALERVGLPGCGPKQVTQLSGGQRQRVAIARCLVLEPAVLLLDEPLGALDLKLREHMKLELKQLQHQFGTTFVYITHDQSEALVMSDQVAVMNGGRFEQVASPQTLYYEPATAFVVGFVGDSHRWRGRVTQVHADGLSVSTANAQTLQVLGSAATRARPGDELELFVRPEAIRISLADTAAPPQDRLLNMMAGRLESLLFNGANSRAMVRVLSGELIPVALPQNQPPCGLVQGAQVRIAFSARQLMAFALRAGGSP
ncbi:ABC transporter ATP-binding protein [Verminephrobacter aporrectodeae subsp. tuberculatae]|uniref:ABC transporter ATP-binding protein n=1 Tax=Verminephrobacter aporrectodeae subsp. tuberculatae TaxID=1110392 RepID=A0ABT3KYW1_9BURK|nr:ABC transporter ATP-binding protein [Verminephrobacter aporrectodeae]MCW5322985.1 ABC transporter ATP-binding protein [Verminephrobacter aporrectodeae subsp. tuberculatae]MCW8199200.1 ABC transporter ATP-binding protein [Verminephrobacter aporrectodeae subsp. tuberculatae]